VRHTGDRTASEDLVSSCFIGFSNTVILTAMRAGFSAWIYHLARKVAADHFRRNSTAPHATDPDDLHTVPDEAPDAADRAVRTDDTSACKPPSPRLDPDQRELSRARAFSASEA